MEDAIQFDVGPDVLQVAFAEEFSAVRPTSNGLPFMPMENDENDTD